MKQESKYPCWEDPGFSGLPGQTEVCIGHNDCKVRADVTVERMRGVVIWGMVTDCTGVPVSNALVKLLRYEGGYSELRELCRTHTDCQGCYQFDIEQGCEGRYRVLVSPRACSADFCRPEMPPCPEVCEPRCRCEHSRGCRSTTRSSVQYY